MATNVEIVRGAYDAFARGDVPAVLAVLDPKIEWTEAAGFPYAGTYVGPGAIVQNVFVRLGTEWDGFSAVPDDFVASGDTVVSIGTYRGTYKATGKKFAARFAHLWQLRDGRAVRFEQIVDSAKVNEALS